jgi:pimeloyl-ACP methyl ester carboxylesterase
MRRIPWRSCQGREGLVLPVDTRTELVPHWPGRLADLPGGERVYIASTPPPAIPPSADPPAGPARRERVLCVHGMAGSTANWTELMALLEPDFACDALDLPGSGWSPPPATMAGYSVTALAATVVKAIEYLGGPVHLIGNSLGGLVSVRVAASRPDLLRSLTLISPAMPDRLLSLSHAQFPMLAIPRLGDWLLRRAGAYPAASRVRAVMGMVFYDPGAARPERVAQAIAEMQRRDGLPHSRQALIGAARALTAEYLRPAWARRSAWRLARHVSCPVLAIYGSHDRLVSPRMAGRAAREFPGSQVIVLPYTGHVAQMEHPARVAEEFRALAEAARAGQPAGAAGARRRGMPAMPTMLDPVTDA